MNCYGTLSVTYEETVDASVASGIEVGYANIKASLEASIGHSNARSKTFSATCGTSDLQGCAKASYAMQLEVTKNIRKRMVHTYKWKTIIYHDGSSCTTPQLHAGSYPQIYYDAAGEVESTVKGSAYGEASCKTVSFSNMCP